MNFEATKYVVGSGRTGVISRRDYFRKLECQRNV